MNTPLTPGICAHVLDGAPLIVKKVTTKGDKRVRAGTADAKKRSASEGKSVGVWGGLLPLCYHLACIHPLVLIRRLAGWLAVEEARARAASRRPWFG